MLKPRSASRVTDKMRMYVTHVEQYDDGVLPVVPHDHVLVSIDLNLCVGDCSQLWPLSLM